jgi:ankyrin repeat protein
VQFDKFMAGLFLQRSFFFHKKYDTFNLFICSNDRQCTMTNYGQLNKDVYIQIFKFLDVKTMSRLARVNKQHYAIVGKPLIDKQRKQIIKDLDNNSPDISNEQVPLFHEYENIEFIKVENALCQYIHSTNRNTINFPINSNDDPYIADLNGLSPLFAAIFIGSVKALELLIENNANIYVKNEGDDNALHFILKRAVNYQNCITFFKDILMWSMSVPHNPDKEKQLRKYDKIQLSEDMVKRLLEIFKLLLEQEILPSSNLLIINKVGFIPETFAIKHGLTSYNVNFLSLIQKKYDDYQPDSHFNNRLISCKQESEKLINPSDQDLFKSIKAAISKNDVGKLKSLQEENTKLFLSVAIDHGNEIVHYAAKAGSLKALEYMLTKGFPISSLYANSPDNEGNTPLHIAARNQHKDMAALLIQHNAGFSLNKPNNAGKTPVELSNPDNRHHPKRWRLQSKKVYNFFTFHLANYQSSLTKQQQSSDSQYSYDPCTPNYVL